MKLLLVDDDVFLRDMYSQKFMESGHEVLDAESGPKALEIMDNEDNIDVVLLDIVMPKMDGMEFLEKAMANTGQNDISFIVLSNQGESNDKQRALELGAKDYIVKAESVPGDVVKKVEDIMSK